MILCWLLFIMAALVRMTSALNPRRFSLQQTMLRIKDPKVSVPFYEENFGMNLLHRYDFPQWQFSIYFMGIPPPGEPAWPEPGTKESEQRLWTMNWSTLELTHNHGSELDDNFVVNNGNVEPHRGFGHIAMMTPDVYASCSKFEEAGLSFQKKPDGEWLCTHCVCVLYAVVSSENSTSPQRPAPFDHHPHPHPHPHPQRVA